MFVRLRGKAISRGEGPPACFEALTSERAYRLYSGQSSSRRCQHPRRNRVVGGWSSARAAIPQIACDTFRRRLQLLPERRLIPVPVQLAVMNTAERHGELIAHLQGHAANLH